jgi:hypothetical protein
MNPHVASLKNYAALGWKARPTPPNGQLISLVTFRRKIQYLSELLS